MQQGHFEYMDTNALASQSKLISCFGNNAGSGYLAAMIPPAPNQDPAPATETENIADPLRSRPRCTTLPSRTRPRIRISVPSAGRLSSVRTKQQLVKKVFLTN